MRKIIFAIVGILLFASFSHASSVVVSCSVEDDGDYEIILPSLETLKNQNAVKTYLILRSTDGGELYSIIGQSNTADDRRVNAADITIPTGPGLLPVTLLTETESGDWEIEGALGTRGKCSFLNQ